MTKSELVSIVAENRPDLTRKAAEHVVRTIFSCMSDALVDGDRIEIRGFGSFSVRTRPSRVGRNPRTGERVEIEKKRVPHFKVGKALRERLNID